MENVVTHRILYTLNVDIRTKIGDINIHKHQHSQHFKNIYIYPHFKWYVYIGNSTQV